MAGGGGGSTGAESLQVSRENTAAGLKLGGSGGERALDLIKADGDGLNYLLSYATQWWKESGLFLNQCPLSHLPRQVNFSTAPFYRLRIHSSAV